MSDYIKDKVSISNEAKKTIIRMNDRLQGQIWKFVKDWPDIVSNHENLKILADMNFAKKEEIEELTEAFYEMFKVIASSTEVTIRVTKAEENL